MLRHLCDLRFIRSVIGGMWYKLRPDYRYGIYGTYWTKRKPLPNEVLLKVEDYS